MLPQLIVPRLKNSLRNQFTDVSPSTSPCSFSGETLGNFLLNRLSWAEGPLLSTAHAEGRGFVGAAAGRAAEVRPSPCHAMPCHVPCCAGLRLAVLGDAPVRCGVAMALHGLCYAMRWRALLWLVMRRDGPAPAMLCYALLWLALPCLALFRLAMLCLACAGSPSYGLHMLCYFMLRYAMLCDAPATPCYRERRCLRCRGGLARWLGALGKARSTQAVVLERVTSTRTRVWALLSGQALAGV